MVIYRHWLFLLAFNIGGNGKKKRWNEYISFHRSFIDIVLSKEDMCSLMRFGSHIYIAKQGSYAIEHTAISTVYSSLIPTTFQNLFVSFVFDSPEPPSASFELQTFAELFSMFHNPKGLASFERFTHRTNPPIPSSTNHQHTI